MAETLTSVQNPLVRQLAGLKEKKGREGTGLFLIEGIRFVEEALDAGAEIVTVIYSPRLADTERGQALLASAAKRRISLYPVSDKVLAFVADTQTPQGVAAAVRMPGVSLRNIPLERPLLVVVDGIQDPGNMGTIVRTALAAGAAGIITTRGTVDLYNPKTLRSTMGAVFALPVVQGLEPEELVKWLKTQAIPLAVADARGEQVYYQSEMLPPLAIAIGNEGSGPSKLILQEADFKVRIPLANGVESLNAAVATSLLLFESARQQASQR